MAFSTAAPFARDKRDSFGLCDRSCLLKHIASTWQSCTSMILFKIIGTTSGPCDVDARLAEILCPLARYDMQPRSYNYGLLSKKLEACSPYIRGLHSGCNTRVLSPNCYETDVELQSRVRLWPHKPPCQKYARQDKKPSHRNLYQQRLNCHETLLAYKACPSTPDSS